MAENFTEQDTIADTAAEKLRLGAFVIWLVLIGVTIATAGPVWYQKAVAMHINGWRAYEDAAFHTFHAFFIDDSYADEAVVNGNLGLIIARWTGAFTALWTVVLAAASIFNATMIGLGVALTRGHTLILGDHPLANAMAAVAARKGFRVVHISERVKDPVEEGTRVTLPRPSNEMGLKRGRATAAKRVIVAKSDLGTSAELGLQATRLVSSRRRRPFVAIHLEDPTTAEHIHHLSDGDHAYAFSIIQASARDVVFRYPPFLLADKVGADAVHVVVVGLGHLGEAVVRDIVLNTRTCDQGKPWITIVDPNPDIHKSFFARHPEIQRAAHVRFFPREAGEPIIELYRDLDGDLAPRICAAYICIPDSAVALNAAIAFKELAQREALFEGPIFVREANGGGLFRPNGGVKCFSQPLQLVGFGGLEAAVHASDVLDEDPDAYARSVHEAYSTIYNRLKGDNAVTDWDHLPEEFRMSNRRIISHLPAKLASLGFDLESWLTMNPDARPTVPALAPDQKLIRDESDRVMMAKLEHQRWMNDRYVNGWRYGETRSNTQKIHPDLIPFETLHEDAQAFDFGVADWLDKFLRKKKGGLTRR